MLPACSAALFLRAAGVPSARLVQPGPGVPLVCSLQSTACGWQGSNWEYLWGSQHAVRMPRGSLPADEMSPKHPTCPWLSEPSCSQDVWVRQLFAVSVLWRLLLQSLGSCLRGKLRLQAPSSCGPRGHSAGQPQHGQSLCVVWVGSGLSCQASRWPPRWVSFQNQVVSTPAVCP